MEICNILPITARNFSKRLFTLSCAELPEGYGGCGSYVEGVDVVTHGDSCHIVGLGYGGVSEAVAFSSHHDSKTRFGTKCVVVDRY